MLRDGCYFLLAQKVTKDALGAASGEHLACGGAHSHCPLDPHITGDALLKNFYTLPAALRQDLYSFSPRPTGAYMGRN